MSEAVLETFARFCPEAFWVVAGLALVAVVCWWRASSASGRRWLARERRRQEFLSARRTERDLIAYLRRQDKGE